MTISFGEIAFNAYSQQMNGQTYDGKAIPQWPDLSAAVQFGWEAAAEAVIDQVTILYMKPRDAQTQNVSPD